MTIEWRKWGLLDAGEDLPDTVRDELSIKWDSGQRIDDITRDTYLNRDIRGRYDYARQFLQNPIEFVARENTALAADSKLPITLLSAELVRRQNLIFNSFVGPKKTRNEISPQTYVELRGVWSLAPGDILPGGNFDLGNSSTYNRELLVLSRTNPAVHNAILEAKMRDVHRRSRGYTEWDVAERIFERFQSQYSEHQDGYVTPGIGRTVGEFMDRGGCCRHRAAAISLVLQGGAGLYARYTRGQYGWAGRHAVSYLYKQPGEEVYAYIDPNMTHPETKERGYMTKVGPSKRGEGERVGLFNPEAQRNVVWRPIRR